MRVKRSFMAFLASKDMTSKVMAMKTMAMKAMGTKAMATKDLLWVLYRQQYQRVERYLYPPKICY